MNIDETMEKMRRELGVPAPPGAPLPAEELMLRVRAEVARKRLSSGMATHVSNGQADRPALERWVPSAERLPFQGEYRLSDLLSFSDLDFVDQCYRIVLRRPPDRAGLDHYVAQLRLGHMSKVEVLGEMRFSPEGVSRGVHVDGLLIPYRLHKIMKWPLVGPVLRWCHGMARLGSHAARLQQLDAAQAREAHCLGHTLNRVAAQLEARIGEAEDTARRGLDHQNHEMKEGQARFDALVEEARSTAAQLAERASALEQAAPKFAVREQVEAGMHEVKQLTTALSGQLQLMATRENVDGLQAALHASLDELRRASDHLGQRIAVGEEALAALDRVQRKAEETSRALEPVYSAFEDRFRGSRELVRSRVEPYLQWVRDAGAGTPEAPVLDLGCGRGEWLELLRDNVMYCRGIDLNATFIEACRSRGLEAQHADVMDGLAGCPDHSVGAITSMHLVEHLPFEVVIAMIDEALRVLRPGGLLLLETPNPENLRVGAHWFYLDPTHRNPIPPETLRWLVESRGFQAARIERLTLGRDMPWPERVADDVPGAELINAMSDQFVAAPDYAIVAVRP